MRTSNALFAAAVFGFVALLSCGGDHPGGTVGEACSDPGSSAECESGEICDAIDGGDAYCLRECDDHDDCDPDERCNGVSGDDEKACHPDDDDDDGDGDLDLVEDGDGDDGGKKGKG